MSDLLSPFIVLFEDDSDAFWCFESLLRRVVRINGPVGLFVRFGCLRCSSHGGINGPLSVPLQRHNFQMEGPVGVMKQLEALPKILELTDVQLSRHFSNVGADSFLFAFRMLLVLFRRELSFGESLFMWEVSFVRKQTPVKTHLLTSR